jgi:hypothetical protein
MYNYNSECCMKLGVSLSDRGTYIEGVRALGAVRNI